jgi:hypothetical protein
LRTVRHLRGHQLAGGREGEYELSEREVTTVLADFASELLVAEQALILQLLERVNGRADALEVRTRADGLASLVSELRQDGNRMAA